MPGTVVRDANEVDLLSGVTLNATGSDVAGTAVEVLWPEGVQILVETGTITGTSPTLELVVQASENSDFSTEPVVEVGRINLTGTDDDGEFAIVANGDFRYVRASVTIAGTTPVFTGTTAKVVPVAYHRRLGAHPSASAVS